VPSCPLTAAGAHETADRASTRTASSTLNLSIVNVVRSFERRLEQLLEGVTGRVFSGRLHSAEIAGKLAREADFARFDHETGPATANIYNIVVHPRDLSIEPAMLEKELANEIETYTMTEGLRLEGPVKVSITSSGEVSPGTVLCHVEVQPGPPVPWARLTSANEMLDIGRIRAIVGRDSGADVVLAHQDISRRHALIWSQGGQSWIRDLGSSNGTTLDGSSVERDLRINEGSVVAFGSNRYRFGTIDA